MIKLIPKILVNMQNYKKTSISAVLAFFNLCKKQANDFVCTVKPL